MFSLAAFLLLAALPVPQDAKPQDQSTIPQLVADLGSPDPSVRENAEQELLKLGRPAVPALREAARSRNAERAMRARTVLVQLAQEERGKDEKDGKGKPSADRGPAPRMALIYQDWTRGIHFTLRPNGSVQLTVPEKDGETGRREFKTYRADSLEEFRKKYPEVANKCDIDKLLSVREIPFEDDQLREWLGLRNLDGRSLYDEDSGRSRSAEGRRFGIMLSPVGPALASHLGLREGEGLLVRQVEPGSLAENSGVKPYDVIVKLDGEKTHAKKIEEFRRSLEDAMASKEFTLERIRDGKRDTIRVKPPEDKKDAVK